MTKILVIGQGIAGTALAWALERRGASVTVADAGFPDSASLTAAGLVNPVTGQRYVKSWMLDEFLPVARRVYAEMEAVLGVRTWRERAIVRLLGSAQEENEWASRCGLADYQPFMASRADAGDWSPFVREGFQFGELRQAAQVDFPALTRAFRKKCLETGHFIQQEITPAVAETLSREFDLTIFCLGFRGQRDPFFPDLAWNLAKGEALFVRLDDRRAAAIGQMLKKKITLVPFGENLFWAGANYDWNLSDTGPTEAGKAFIVNELEQMLATPFEVVAHLAAVRPTVRDRRPFIGLHPTDGRFGIFNGFGSKGALQTPYWAARFAEHILDGAPLPAEVDVRRCFSR